MRRMVKENPLKFDGRPFERTLHTLLPSCTNLLRVRR
jgi:hypothetical protein